MQKYNLIVKCFGGYEYALKYRNIGRNRLTGQIDWLMNNHPVTVIFIYDAHTKQYVANWTPQRGFNHNKKNK